MKTKRLGFAITTGTVAVCFAIAVAVAATITLVVYPGNLQGWQIVTAAGAQPTPAATPSVTFVNGPATPPLGSGSAQLSVGSDGGAAAELRHPNYAGTVLPTPTPTPDPQEGEITYPAGANELSELTYSTYVQQPGSGSQAPYIILQMDYDNNGTVDDLLYFEPQYQNGNFCPSLGQNPVATGVWQTWNALDGCWWSQNGVAGSGPGANVKPLTTIGAAQPNAKVVNSVGGNGGVRIVTGYGAGAWDNFLGNVDAFRIGVGEDTDTGPNVTEYDFETGAGGGGSSTDVGVTKSTDTEETKPDTDVTYTIEVRNNGQAADNLTLTDTLPGNMTFVSINQTSGPTLGCTYPAVGSGGTITCTTASYPAGGISTFTLVGHVPSGAPEGTTYTNTASVSTSMTDTNSENDASSVTTTVVTCLSAYTVTTNADSGPGSLRQAILEVCSGGGISFVSGLTAPIDLTSGELHIDKSLTIFGPGANILTVQRSPAGETPNFRIFNIDAGKIVNISGLSLYNGTVIGAAGGGILNNGTLNLDSVTVIGNAAADGFGIYNNASSSGATATLTITNSTINGNFNASPSGSRGAIFNNASGTNSTATLTITNSTISGNVATNGSGGGVYNFANNSGATATANITNSTITNNTASSGAGIVNLVGGSGGTATTKLGNTIVAGNLITGSSTPSDILGTVDPTSSFNLIGAGGSGGLSNGVNGNQVGVADARLAPLAFNGGPTRTHALLIGSPALDAGSNTLASDAGLTTDQRGPGFPRVRDAADADTTQTVDIGAYEADPTVEDISDKGTLEDTPLVFNFNVGDSATPFDSITATSSNQTLVPDANLQVSGSDSTRTLTVTPAANQSGTATITVTVTKTIGGTTLSMTDTFLLTVTQVNDAPTLNTISPLNINEDAPQQTVNLTGISAGPGESQTITVTATSNNTALIPNPTVTYTSPNSTGSISFTPVANQSGSADITVTVKDNGGTANGGVDTFTRTFIVTVTAVNDAPVNTVPGTQSVIENSSITLSSANSNAISISDIDAGSAAVRVTLTATNGTVTLSGTTGLSFTVGDGTSDAQMTFTGTIANINAALNGLQFSPTQGFSGAASLQIVTNDQGNTGSGGPQSDTDTVNITVQEGGAFAFSSATYSVSESGGSVTITVTRTSGTAGEARVNYATSNGTATAGQDYTAASGTFIFAEGETSKTFNVSITSDTLDEANETVNLTLSNPQGSGALGTPATAVLTIQDDDPSPSLSINDVTVAEGNSGTTSAIFTVTLSTQSGQAVTVNYATADGTATTAGNDYLNASGTLTFDPGQTTKTITVFVVGDTLAEPSETFFVNLSGATNASISDNQGLGTISAEDATQVQFAAAEFTVAEDALRATITVNRLGDLSLAASVDYFTSDTAGLTPCSVEAGKASERCDYATSVGTLRFAPGQASKTILIPIVNDSYKDQNESFTITLRNPVAAELISPSVAKVNITDNDPVTGPNPLLSNEFFVRQLYIDFLGREPDPPGLAAWLQILQGLTPQCKVATDCDRVAVAAGFVGSPEFRDRGYFVYRVYAAALGRIPHYNEFIPDMARVNGFLSDAELEANKQAFIADFMSRAEFRNKYDALGNTAFVDALIQAAGLPAHPARNNWIIGLNNGTLTRAQVLRQLVDSTEVINKFINEAFIVMNYFGFLRRDPDAAYQGWIQIFNQSNDYRLVIAGFMNSNEYALRFGP